MNRILEKISHYTIEDSFYLDDAYSGMLIMSIIKYFNIKFDESNLVYEFSRIIGWENIEFDENVEHLDLQGEEIQHLLRLIRFPKNLKFLNISNNILTEDDLMKTEFPKGLKVLNLRGNDIYNLDIDKFKKNQGFINDDIKILYDK